MNEIGIAVMVAGILLALAGLVLLVLRPGGDKYKIKLPFVEVEVSGPGFALLLVGLVMAYIPLRKEDGHIPFENRESRAARVISDDEFDLTSYFEPVTWLPSELPTPYSGKPDTQTRSGIQAEIIHDFECQFLGRGGKITCIKVTFPSTKDETDWIGIYWLPPSHVWERGGGTRVERARHLRFRARTGVYGGMNVEFVVGGILPGRKDQPTDRFERSTGVLNLGYEWTDVSVDLSGEDLRHLVGAFGLRVRRSLNQEAFRPSNYDALYLTVPRFLRERPPASQARR